MVFDFDVEIHLVVNTDAVVEIPAVVDTSVESVDFLLDCFVDCSEDCLVDCSVGCLVDCSVDGSVD